MNIGLIVTFVVVLAGLVFMLRPHPAVHAHPSRPQTSSIRRTSTEADAVRSGVGHERQRRARRQEAARHHPRVGVTGRPRDPRSRLAAFGRERIPELIESIAADRLRATRRERQRRRARFGIGARPMPHLELTIPADAPSDPRVRRPAASSALARAACSGSAALGSATRPSSGEPSGRTGASRDRRNARRARVLDEGGHREAGDRGYLRGRRRPAGCSGGEPSFGTLDRAAAFDYLLWKPDEPRLVG